METVLRSVILAILRAGAAQTIETSPRRLALATLFGGVTAILAAAGLGCAALALWIWQIPQLGTIGASLTVSALLFAAALAGLGALRRVLAAPTAKPSPLASGSLAPLLGEAQRLFNDHKGAALVVALLAGLAMERHEREK
jgi:hypothetical protein